MRLLLATVAACLACAPAALASAPHRTPNAEPNALAQCGTYKVSWFDGFDAPSGTGTAEGAFAQITSRSNSQCQSDMTGDNFTTVWAMIATGATSGSLAGGYVQSGFFHRFGDCTQHFAETRRNNSYTPYNRFSGCVGVNVQESYGERYGPSCQCEYAKINGKVFVKTDWNPYYYFKYPFNPQLFGGPSLIRVG
jgi:hypothetical protein